MRTPKPATPPSQIVLAPLSGASSVLMIVSVNSFPIALAHSRQRFVSIAVVCVLPPASAKTRRAARDFLDFQGMIDGGGEMSSKFKGLGKGSNAGLHPEGREFETL